MIHYHLTIIFRPQFLFCPVIIHVLIYMLTYLQKLTQVMQTGKDSWILMCIHSFGCYPWTPLLMLQSDLDTNMDNIYDQLKLENLEDNTCKWADVWTMTSPTNKPLFRYDVTWYAGWECWSKWREGGRCKPLFITILSCTQPFCFWTDMQAVSNYLQLHINHSKYI